MGDFPIGVHPECTPLQIQCTLGQHTHKQHASKSQVPCYSNTTTDKHSLVVGILLDNSSIENGFNNMLTLKTFFQSMLLLTR